MILLMSARIYHRKTSRVYQWLLLLIACISCLLSNTAIFANTNPHGDDSTQQTAGYKLNQDNNELIDINQKDIYKFGLAIEQIRQFYINVVSDDKIFADAIEGVLAGLDPHSTYLDEEELALLNEANHGEFSGLGIEVTMENGLVKIISPIDDSPAEKAGIKAGDMILAVDGKPLTSISLTNAIKKMRGKSGTSITLTVINKNQSKPKVITIKRGIIPLESVKSRMLTPVYGYLRISQFQEDTAKKTKKALNNLKKEAKGNLRGIILDLRNNPGGLLESAVDVSNLFLDSQKLGKNKLITFTQGRIKANDETFNATSSDQLNGLPIIILINNGSASAAEIVAGALQDHKRALIVGQQSFGKGSIQTLLPLDEKTAIKLTIALYYTPHGRVIQTIGIKPDIEIDNLKLKDNQSDAPSLLNITEKSLEQHIEIQNKEAETQTVSAQEMKQLAKDDYQLYEALQLLRSSVILKTQHH